MHFSQLLELQTEQKLRFVIELLNHSNLAIAIKLEVVCRHLTCHAFWKRVLDTAHCVSLIGIYQKCHWVQWGRKGKIIGFTRKKKEKNERKWFFVVIKPEQHSLACVLKLLWPGVQKAARQGRRQILMYFRGVIRTSCWPERRAFLSFQLLFLPAEILLDVLCLSAGRERHHECHCRTTSNHQDSSKLMWKLIINNLQLASLNVGSFTTVPSLMLWARGSKWGHRKN